MQQGKAMKINSSFLNIFPKTISATEAKNNNFATNLLNGDFSNLAPLPFDTVSFGEARKRGNIAKKQPMPAAAPVRKVKKSSSSDKRIDHAERTSLNLTQRIYNESEFAFNKLKLILSDAFPGVTVIDADNEKARDMMTRELLDNKDKPVVLITARRKHPASISEKMAQAHLRSKKGAKERINDLIGARIIVSGTSTQEGEYVLDKLTEAVKKGRFKVAHVKNHLQEDNRLNYVGRKRLNKFVDDNRRINGISSCKYTDEPRDSGYLAIHIITDDIEDGYNAEIQIMGLDVERFKELEDICYKCHAKKGVLKKYRPLEEMFKPVQDNPQLQKDFIEYTKRAYAFERLKPVHGEKEKMEYLSIPSDLNIPPELDFNNLARVKASIDRNANSGV